MATDQENNLLNLLTCRASAHRFFSLSLTLAEDKSLLYFYKIIVSYSKRDSQCLCGQMGVRVVSEVNTTAILLSTLENWLPIDTVELWAGCKYFLTGPGFGCRPSRQCFLPLYHLRLLLEARTHSTVDICCHIFFLISCHSLLKVSCHIFFLSKYVATSFSR